MKVVLFGLTGMGNHALTVLDEMDSLELSALFTCKEPKGEFPYYPCEKIHALARRKQIRSFEGLRMKGKEAERTLAELSPDLLVVCSFDQIIPASIIGLATCGVINIHPSLLPRYRGATPVFWTLANGEGSTGVTAHLIEDEKVDSGRIVWQDSLEILPEDTTGSLRKRLGLLSESVLRKALELVMSKDKEEFELQDESKASSNPKRGTRIVLDPDTDTKDIVNLVR
ncbi:MAG: hypothetical protein GY946_10385, partial [bacterium]|nr:hypothetical protein [bacterium]